MPQQRSRSAKKTSLSRKPGVLLWFRIARIYTRNLRAASDHLRPYGLSAAQFDILAHVGSSTALTQQDLARRMLVTEGNITQLLDKMQTRGLLARRREGRVNHLMLTAAGHTLYEQVRPEQERLQSRQFGPLSVAEQRQLLALLRKLERAGR